MVHVEAALGRLAVLYPSAKPFKAKARPDAAKEWHRHLGRFDSAALDAAIDAFVAGKKCRAPRVQDIVAGCERQSTGARTRRKELDEGLSRLLNSLYRPADSADGARKAYLKLLAQLEGEGYVIPPPWANNLSEAKRYAGLQ